MQKVLEIQDGIEAVALTLDQLLRVFEYKVRTMSKDLSANDFMIFSTGREKLMGLKFLKDHCVHYVCFKQ